MCSQERISQAAYANIVNGNEINFLMMVEAMNKWSNAETHPFLTPHVPVDYSVLLNLALRKERQPFSVKSIICCFNLGR